MMISFSCDTNLKTKAGEKLSSLSLLAVLKQCNKLVNRKLLKAQQEEKVLRKSSRKYDSVH